MINVEKTKTKFGYDPTGVIPHIGALGVRKKDDLVVIDYCHGCNKEREIKYRQSKINSLCPKCFHNLPEMVAAKSKANKGKIVSEETKEKMRANHWSKQGMESPYKGKIQDDESKELSRQAAKEQSDQKRLELGEEEYSIRMSLMKSGLSREEFAGFTSPENTLLRQSPEGKVWTREILAKANFTCIKCQTRGGTLHAHHKNAFNSFPEQRFDVENGACLCETCHDKFHVKYGKGSNTKEQFLEWMNEQ